MTDRLKQLCLLNGISGREDDVRKYIVDKLESFTDCSYRVDALGNVIVEKKGKKTPAKRIMIDAHMDEVGLIVTHITDDGFIRFSSVGGIETGILLGKRVAVNSLNGVIGVKPIHLLDKENAKKISDEKELYIDIGAETKADAEKYVRPGDSIYFVSEFYEFGDGLIKAKAIDDRLGCALLLDLLEKESEYDFVATFSTQEEIGTRGASVLVSQVRPDYAIVLETTTACDLDGIDESKKVCKLGNGPVVSFMDRGTIYDRELYNKAFEVASENNIPIQTKSLVAGGNNASAIHQSFGGVKTLAISVACRYLHSPSCVISSKDIKPTYELLNKMIGCLCND